MLSTDSERTKVPWFRGLHTILAYAPRESRETRRRCSTGKWPDRIHEYSVPCISEIHSESVTRFISCNFTRNSGTTRLRIVAPNRGTDTWLELETWRSAELFPACMVVMSAVYSTGLVTYTQSIIHLGLRPVRIGCERIRINNRYWSAAMRTVLSWRSVLCEIINSPPSAAIRTRRVRTGINQFWDPVAARTILYAQYSILRTHKNQSIRG